MSTEGCPGCGPHDGFAHCVLLVVTDRDLHDRLVPALRRSLDAGQPVLMMVSGHTEQVVREALGARAVDLEWGDCQEAFGRRLGFIYEAFRRYLVEQQRAGRRVHVVAEPDIRGDPGGSVDRIAAYLPYEAMCNDAYAAYGCTITCIWDSRRHPTLVVENVRTLHHCELTASGQVANPDFIPPIDYLFGRNQIVLEAPPPGVDLDLTLLDLHELALLRAKVRDWADALGFDRIAVDDVVVATHEAVTNGLVHGAPPVRVRGWHLADTLIVQVDDAGGTQLPSLAGYQPPSETRDGHGLWITRQLADVLTTSTDGDRTTVRLHFPHRVTHLDTAE